MLSDIRLDDNKLRFRFCQVLLGIILDLTGLSFRVFSLPILFFVYLMVLILITIIPLALVFGSTVKGDYDNWKISYFY